MSESAEALVPIDLTLRFVLFGLECALGVVLSAPEAERVFREAAENGISTREYIFHQSRNLSITGRVDESESETILLHIEGRREIATSLARVVETAAYHAGRLRRAEHDA
jgi:hypothetical protein